MELKTARLTLLIDPNKKAAFERLCAQRDLTASQVVRQMIRDYLAEHGVSYEPSGAMPAEDDATEAPQGQPVGKAVSQPKPKPTPKPKPGAASPPAARLRRKR